MTETRIIHITGKVQGVYFRQSTKEQADKLGITGNVRNMPDGSVQVIATGNPEQLKQLVDWCHVGPANASVAAVTSNITAVQLFERFAVER